MKLRHVLTTCAASAALAAGLAAPAHAAPGDDTKVIAVVVADADDAPLAGIGVELVSVEDEDLYLDLGETDAEGKVSAVGEDVWEDALEPGEYTVHATDYSEARFNTGRDFASFTLPETITIVEDGTTVIPTIRMAAGGRIVGKITAPSGRPVANAIVFALKNGQYEAFRASNGKGQYVVSGLSAGTGYVLTASQVANSFGNFGAPTNVRNVSIEAGQDVQGSITNHRVRCTQGLTVTSTKKGQVKVAVTSTAPSNGLAAPGGKVVIKRGTKVIKTVAWNKIGSASFTFKKQAKGKKYSYSATYTGGDCISWSAARTVKVKK